MALVPYRDANDSPKRNRSSSFSTPSATSFIYQEVLNFGGNTLIRSYSCDRIIKKLKGGQTFQSTFVRVSSFVSPIRRFSKAPIRYRPRFSTVSQSKRKKAAKLKLSRGWRFIDLIYKYTNVTYIFLHIILITLLISFALRINECNKSWNITDTVHKLRNNVFGQEAAINEVETILNEFSHSNSSLVVAFTGTIGVGKTLVSSIIYDNFPWSSNQYISFFSDGLEERISSKKYSFSSANLLIVDGIHISTAKTAINVIAKLLVSLAKDQKLLVIMVFQIQSENDEAFILENLKHEQFKYFHVPFKNLNEETIMECFKVEFKRQNKSILSVNLNELVKQQMKICPVSKSQLGCKNVFHQVSFLPDNE